MRKPDTRALILGGLLLLWLSVEDQHSAAAAALGVALAALLTDSYLLARARLGAWRGLYALSGAALAGALIGLGGAVAAAALMLFKNALHAHLFLDFPPAMVLAMVGRAPAWALAGALAGLGLGMARLTLRQEPER